METKDVPSDGPAIAALVRRLFNYSGLIARSRRLHSHYLARQPEMLRKAANGEEPENQTSFLSPNTPVAVIYRHLDKAAKILEKREEITGNSQRTFLPGFCKQKDRLEKFNYKRAVEWAFDAIVDSAIKIKEPQRRLIDTLGK